MKILLLFTTLILTAITHSQMIVQNQALATSGNSFTDGNIVIDYTFGEVFTESLPLGSMYSVTQGFQQPSDVQFSTIGEIDASKISVYPNPFRSELNIEISKNQLYELFIFDNTGRFIKQIQLTKMINSIELSELAVGNYQVVLINQESLVTRIPVIKSN
jgi:hypothetical protein